MDLVIPTGIGDLGLGGLVTLVLLLVWFGKLIPRSTHQDRITDLKEQLAEKEAQNQYLQTALDKRDEQLSQQIQNNQVAVNALEAIRREAARA